MNVQLVRICNTNALNISICNAKRTSCLLFYRIANPYIPQQLDYKSSRTGVEGNTKNPQPKPSPKLRILRLKIDYRPDGLIE